MDTPIIPSGTPYNDAVYDPAEDSFLLLDALEKDIPAWLSESEKCNPIETRDLIVLEAGCGSGLISTAMANFSVNDRIFVPLVLALDVNPHACSLTQLTARRNNAGGSVEVINMDALLCPMSLRKLEFDIIVCNPPYVPVLPEEKYVVNSVKKSEWFLDKSWDGGPDGNSFIVPFLKVVPSLLSDNGVLYLLLSHWNSPQVLMDDVAGPQGLKSTQIMSRAAGQERLSVWRLVKVKN